MIRRTSHMKRMIEWLETKLSRSKAPVVADEPSDSASVEPDDDHESTQDERANSLPDLAADSPDESTGYDPSDTDVMPKK